MSFACLGHFEVMPPLGKSARLPTGERDMNLNQNAGLRAARSALVWLATEPACVYSFTVIVSCFRWRISYTNVVCSPPTRVGC